MVSSTDTVAHLFQHRVHIRQSQFRVQGLAVIVQIFSKVTNTGLLPFGRCRKGKGTKSRNL